MWPSRWFTPTRGRRRAYAIALAAEQPMRREPTSPGPYVTARPSTSSSPTPAPSRARRTTGISTSRWRREASSGTTPPYGACTSSCEATMLASTLRPPSTTAAAVSSQEVSIPSTIMVCPLAGQLRDRDQAQPAGFPARYVFLQEPDGQRMTVGDHDHLAPSLRPARHLLPPVPIPRLAVRVVHQDLATGRTHSRLPRLVEGHRLA